MRAHTTTAAIIRFTVNERGGFLKSKRQLADSLLRHYEYTIRWCRQWSITA